MRTPQEGSTSGSLLTAELYETWLKPLRNGAKLLRNADATITKTSL